MVPFLCEIALCCIVSYHIALLLVQRGRAANQENDATVPASQSRRGAASVSQGQSN